MKSIVYKRQIRSVTKACECRSELAAYSVNCKKKKYCYKLSDFSNKMSKKKKKKKKKISQQFPVQTEKSQTLRLTELNWQTRGKPRFRHYPFTLGLRFFGLHRRPMTDSICRKQPALSAFLAHKVRKFHSDMFSFVYHLLHFGEWLY